MAQARCGSTLHVQQEAATAGEHGVAAVVAMLQSERRLPRTGGDGFDEVVSASTTVETRVAGAFIKVDLAFLADISRNARTRV